MSHDLTLHLLLPSRSCRPRIRRQGRYARAMAMELVPMMKTHIRVSTTYICCVRGYGEGD